MNNLNRHRKVASLIKSSGGIEPLMEIIFKQIANGGSLITLCEGWGIKYSDMIHWIKMPGNASVLKLYEAAEKAGLEWMRIKLVDELKTMSTVDVRSAFDQEGRLKPLDEMPPDAAKMIAGIETYETFDRVYDPESGDKRKVAAGQVRKVRFHDKLRAIELLGKKLAMFINRLEMGFEGDTLEALVMKSKVIVVPDEVADNGSGGADRTESTDEVADNGSGGADTGVET